MNIRRLLRISLQAIVSAPCPICRRHRISLVNLPLSPTIPATVTRCAVSAIALPLTTILSNVDISAARLAICAARNLATFSAGVSLTGAGPAPPPLPPPLVAAPALFPVLEYAGLDCDGCGAERRAELETGLLYACGEVAVNLVASEAERGIVKRERGYCPRRKTRTACRRRMDGALRD